MHVYIHFGENINFLVYIAFFSVICLNFLHFNFIQKHNKTQQRN